MSYLHALGALVALWLVGAATLTLLYPGLARLGHAARFGLSFALGLTVAGLLSFLRSPRAITPPRSTVGGSRRGARHGKQPPHAGCAWASPSWSGGGSSWLARLACWSRSWNGM